MMANDVYTDDSAQCSGRCQQCPDFRTCDRWVKTNNTYRLRKNDPETKTNTRKPVHESDPTGRHPNDPGAKLDAGKTRVWLVLSGFANALLAVSEVGTFGAKKYSDDGWKKVPDAYNRYSDALMRHLLAEASGETYDPDSGLLHAAHSAWNALARLEKILAGD